MGFGENIRLALTAIHANRTRSFLTMLGIIIGISSVITITTIGNSLERTMASTMNSISGSNMIYVAVEPDYPETSEGWDAWIQPEMLDSYYITYEEIIELMDAFKGKIKYVNVDESFGSGTYSGTKRKVNVAAYGTMPDVIENTKLKMIAGRDITKEDNDQSRPVCVVSDLFVKYALGTDENPLGKEVELEINDVGVVPCYIVGIYHYDKRILGGLRDSTAPKDRTTQVYMPVTYSFDFYPADKFKGFTYIKLVVEDDADVQQVKQELKDYYAEGKFNGITDYHAEISDMASMMSTISNVLNVVTVAVAVIAGISLIVGGVGVMNIMLISVMERTREIGIRKALGARNKDIRSQFLTEAIILCMIGGFIGVAIGLVNGFLLAEVARRLVVSFASDMANMLDITVRPSIGAIIVSVGFSMLTGLGFGYYPANRAARLEPIDALRYE